MNEREIFLAVLEINNVETRREFLHRACNGNPELRKGVEALLASHEVVGDFLKTPVVQPQVVPPAAATILESLGELSAAEAMRSDDASPLAFLSPTKRPDSLGRLAHYEVLEVLGRGAFGTVFRAFDEKLHRLVAVKMLSAEIAATSPARQRFLREARSAAAIRHENVVAIYSVEERPIPHLAMEYIPGKTLQEVVDEQGPLDAAEVLRIGQYVALGLAAAHARGLIHRDIKPANILLEDGVQRQVKITDFGLARAVDDASMTQSAVIAGTPMYMSPEQARGDQIDQRSDLFSLGTVLYQLVSGHPPFRAATSFAILQRVATDSPRPLREIIPEIPAPLTEIIAKLHAKRPEDRYQTAAEVAVSIAGLLTSLQRKENLNVVQPRPLWPRSTRFRQSLAAAILLGLALAISGTWLQYKDPAATTIVPVQNHVLHSVAKPAIAPFNPVAAARFQVDWANHLGGPVEFKNTIGMRFHLIPPGEFIMGTAAAELAQLVEEARAQKFPPWYLDNVASEGPAHLVRITQPYYVSVYETTVDQFRQLVVASNYATESIREGKGGVYDGDQSHDPPLSWEVPFPDTIAKDYEPVRQVTWNDAQQFCAWLSKKEQRDYRLLTEAEWEYACRAGTTTRFHAGDKLSKSQARIGSIAPNRVGSYPPNAWGLCDMLGNINEWCFDQIATNYGELPVNDPVDRRPGQDRVLRGGAFFEIGPRSAFRRGKKKSYCADTIGFRVALSVESVR